MSKVTNYFKTVTTSGEEIMFPVATITGTNPGKHFVITAGLHGAEYPGIAAAIKLFKDIDPIDVSGEITIIPIQSVKAFENRTVFVCPVDGKNPNRVFPGKADGSYTEQLVYHLLNDFIKKGDYHVDLHSGDLIETLANFAICHVGAKPEVDKASKEIAAYYNVGRVLITRADAEFSDVGGAHSGVAEAGVPSAIVEVGGAGKMDKESIDIHYNGLINVLRHFGILKGEAIEPKDTVYYEDVLRVRSPEKGIFYPAVEVGNYVNKGQLLGRLEDYFGNLICEIFAEKGGQILFMTSSPAMPKDDVIMNIGAY